MLDYPGLGLPLCHYNNRHDENVYPIGIHPRCEGAESEMIYDREVAMMLIMDRLTDKPDWQRKVFDEKITSKWIDEALALPDDLFTGDGVAGGSEEEWKDIESVVGMDVVDEGDSDGRDESEGRREGGLPEEKDGDAGADAAGSDSASDSRDHVWTGAPRQWKMKRLKNVLTRECMEYCIKELQAKAEYFKASGVIPTLDATFCVAKSDTLVTDDLREALIAAFDRLKTDQADRPDWHPETNDMVLDLVHPSMYPLVYGRSRVLKDEVVGVGDAIFRWAGKGDIIPKSERPAEPQRWNADTVPPSFWSDTYQWLPSNVSFVESGVRFTSYINNLHPIKHAEIYRTIERLIETALPVWDQCVVRLRMEPKFGRRDPRFPKPESGKADDENYDNWEPAGGPAGVPDEDVANYNWDEDEDYNESEFDDDEDREEHKRDVLWRNMRRAVHPSPPEFTLVDRGYEPDQRCKLRSQFNESGLQIIVKLASIELTPEKPSYAGGGWHVEGQMNEHIVGTAIYYLDCENVTASHLEFAAATDDQVSSDEDWAFVGQDQYHWLEHVFGFENWASAIQHYGSVETRERRLLAFPNVFQHRVSAFALRDKTKPGHRRFVVLWLVDPTTRIISTANVPPQRADWWLETALSDFDDARGGGGTTLAQTMPPEVLRLMLESTADDPATMEELLPKVQTPSRLPNEVLHQIRTEVGDGAGLPMSRREAEGHREALMKERQAVEKKSSSAVWSTSYSFCEH